MMIVSDSLRLIKRWWRLLFILLIPFVLLPLPLIIKTIQCRCAYIVLVLTAYWVSEAIPYAVTSLLPLALFPLGGIVSGDQIGLNYFKDITTMFVGSMSLAYAMEHVRLHRRLALLVLRYVGSSIMWSMAGLMGVTAFLSMWINNSASANIMIPTAMAIVNELHNYEKRTIDNNNNKDVSNLDTSEMKRCSDTQSSVLENIVIGSNIITNQSMNVSNAIDYEYIKKGYLISVAFSAAVGGMITLVGTGPNIFVKGFSDQYYSSGSIRLEISFSNFLLFGMPIGVTLLILCWLWLQVLYNRQGLFRCKKSNESEIESENKLETILKDQYKELGPLSWQEYSISVLFVLVVILWMTRDFSSSRGWDILFRTNYVTDGTTAILIGCLPLILPDKNPFTDQWEYNPIVRWDELSKGFPWGVFMLQGAGLAIADGFKVSDLSSTIATFLHFIVGSPPMLIILVVIIISAIFTEFTSNLACASILFPILDSIAKTANIHPGRLILPSCMAVSLSFMLPVATPPNAMIFVNGNMKTRDLLKAGFGMKILGILVIFLASIVLVTPIFHIHDIISISNTTIISNITNG